MKKKINWRKKFFNWHIWAGILFSIPVLLVSLTAILIAHKDGLGTKTMLVNAGWLPGYQAKEENISRLLSDIKAFHADGQVTYFGTKLGVVSWNEVELKVIAGTEGAEVRDIIAIGDTLFFATKSGMFRYAGNDSRAERILKGDFHGLAFHMQKLKALGAKQGIWESSDYGRTWTGNIMLSARLPQKAVSGFSAGLEKAGYIEKLSWEKLILDIHTGEAFFGANSKWVWIDLVSLSLLLMTVTGIWMWYKRKFRKKV